MLRIFMTFQIYLSCYESHNIVKKLILMAKQKLLIKRYKMLVTQMNKPTVT